MCNVLDHTEWLHVRFKVQIWYKIIWSQFLYFNCYAVLVGFFLILYHYRLGIYVLYILLKKERNKDNNVLIVEISYALHAYTAWKYFKRIPYKNKNMYSPTLYSI